MQLDTIEITPAEAKAKLREYEAVLAYNRTAEDEAIARGYRQAAKGLPIIRLSEVITAGGFFPNSARPRLAVARADRTRVWVNSPWFTASRRGTVIYSTKQWSRTRTRVVGEHAVEVEGVPIPPDPSAGRARWAAGGSTIVPIVPPGCRPRTRRLGLFHVLWEVEKWDPTPPVDPALIRHVGGDLWAVHAVWDLTELERAMFAGRGR